MNFDAPIVQTVADRATGAAGGAAVVTYAADVDKRHVLAGVSFSYSAAPTGGGLRIEDGSGTTVFEADITAAGINQLIFDPPLQTSRNKAMVVTLLAPGGAVVGKVNCQHFAI